MHPVTFDLNGYHIDGQPQWLLSGEMHYYKLTRGDWRRRLVQLKAAGFNTVSVYMPWNFHEPVEGQWMFDEDRDIEHFLTLAAELGLYVIARPGPFICNEWTGGGIPAWVSANPRIRLRTKDPAFLKFVDRWWDRICPIIRRFELGHEGSIILTQIENEYGHYGEGQEVEYMEHLRDGLRSRGIEGPIINCDSFINFARLKPGIYDGVNMCCNFGGDGIRNLDRARKLQPEAPLFVTEYWIAAFDWWGRDGSAEYEDVRALNGGLEIAAGGAGGLTAFVFSGGAHFGYWHGRSICSDANFMTTLYGPGAPIRDDGTFSPKYALFKTGLAPLALPALARTSMPELETLQDDLLQAVRRGPEGTFIFTLNRSSEQIRIADLEKDQACVDMSIPAGSVQWTVKDLMLPSGAILNRSNLSLLSIDPVLILYGEAGTESWIELDGITHSVTVPENAEPLHLHHADTDILIVNRETASTCWPLSLPGSGPVLFGGPERVEDVRVQDGIIHAKISSPSQAEVWQFRDGSLVDLQPAYRKGCSSTSLSLSNIRVGNELPESKPDFNDREWFAAEQPQRMAVFGHGHGWAWYRAVIHVSDGGPQQILFSGADDRAHAWVNGVYLGTRGWGSSHGWHLMPNLPEGDYTLSLLVDNMGMFNSGPEFDIPLGEPKGIYGPVWLNGEEISGWRMRAGLAEGEGLDQWSTPDDATETHPDQNNVSGPVFVSAEFEMPDEFDGAVRIELGEAATKGNVWLNGFNIGRYWNIGPQQSLWVPLSRLQQNNRLILFEEDHIQPEKITVSLTSFGFQAELELK